MNARVPSHRLGRWRAGRSSVLGQLPAAIARAAVTQTGQRRKAGEVRRSRSSIMEGTLCK
jgi:hypothetical protein